MKPIADRAVAEEALVTLRRLQSSTGAATAKELEVLATKVANPVFDHDRSDAWLAVCHLRDAVTNGSPAVSALRDDAINKTEAWLRWFARPASGAER